MAQVVFFPRELPKDVVKPVRLKTSCFVKLCMLGPENPPKAEGCPKPELSGSTSSSVPRGCRTNGQGWPPFTSHPLTCELKRTLVHASSCSVLGISFQNTAASRFGRCLAHELSGLPTHPYTGTASCFSQRLGRWTDTAWGSICV